MTISVSEALDLARLALMMVLQMAAPILLVGMAVGLVISLLQAVTQIQEQTLSFVPKMLAMGLAAMLFLPWLATKMLEFARLMFGSIMLGT